MKMEELNECIQKEEREHISVCVQTLGVEECVVLLEGALRSGKMAK